MADDFRTFLLKENLRHEKTITLNGNCVFNRLSHSRGSPHLVGLSLFRDNHRQPADYRYSNRSSEFGPGCLCLGAWKTADGKRPHDDGNRNPRHARSVYLPSQSDHPIHPLPSGQSCKDPQISIVAIRSMIDNPASQSNLMNVETQKTLVLTGHNFTRAIQLTLWARDRVCWCLAEFCRSCRG